MLTPSLILTKLSLPPARPVLVPRRRLVERLNGGIQGKMSLISAPAGYGKTTLAAEWLRETRRAVAWLSLDDADNDPVRFLGYFLKALQGIDEKAGVETQSLFQSPQPPSPEALVAVLLNELNEISTPFVVALDDYQLIQTLSIHQLLNAIVEHQPAQMHLVLITREDPPFALPRLRARGQVTEIRQADLRFSAAECAEFLEKVAGLEISKSDIAALERRTEGWAAGLQLAALSMQGRDDLDRFVQEFTGSNRYVLDYLTQEVFENQSLEMQRFLLKTSILDRFCASLCDTVSESPASQKMLEEMEKANLFIVPLDQSRTWFRFHHLFHDLLHNRLKELGEQDLAPYHRRACAWFEGQGLLAEAIQHALAGADWENAYRLIHSALDGMIKQGEIYTLAGWFTQLPEALILNNAEACLEFGWILLLAGQFEHAGVFLKRRKDLPALIHPIRVNYLMRRLTWRASKETCHAWWLCLSRLCWCCPKRTWMRAASWQSTW